MDRAPDHPNGIPDFRRQSSRGVALTAVFTLTPFALYNFLQGRQVIGIGSLIIVLVLYFNAWSISRGHYRPALTLVGLVPGMSGFLAYVIQGQGMIGVLWCYPVLLSYYFMLPERMAWAANALLLAIVLPQVWSSIDIQLAARVVATLLATSAFSVIFIRVISVQQVRMHTMAVTDPLTGLANRLLLDETLEQAVGQFGRTRIPMTLITLDLDHFKAINDTHGHEAGDAVLRGVGDLLGKRVRRSDKVFRLGGEEFLVFLYNTELENARRFAEELRLAVSSRAFLPGHPVTASLGVATIEAGETARGWMKRADDKLYEAKSAGRDRVMS